MPYSAIPKSLIVYSSPEFLDRLRLDEEHRAIDEVLAKNRLPNWVIKRLHAATLLDVASALRESEIEVVQFSCHGDCQGLYLESGESCDVTPWELLAQTLQSAAPSLCAVILNACHSENAEKALHNAAPFLIMMKGSVGDKVASKFSQSFFEEYYRTGGIDRAFKVATFVMETMQLADELEPLLLRREPTGESVASMVQACFGQREDAIFIDVSEAEESISRLPISRHEFLSLLTRKIHIHSWIFLVERDHAVIPIGQFFGVFSWSNARDRVLCHEILQLREDTVVEECMGWTRLMVMYNDLRAQRYRVVADPAELENKPLLSDALMRIKRCDKHALSADDVATAAKKLARTQYLVTLSTVRTQCDFAEGSLAHGDLARVVIALETAISSIHDLVNELTAAVTIPKST